MTYPTNRVNGTNNPGEFLTGNLDYFTITTGVNITPGAFGTTTQVALGTLVTVLSLRGQPIILGTPVATAVPLTTSASTASGSVLPFTSTAGVVVGQGVTGTNIPAGTFVASFVANTSVTLSQAISGTVASGATVTFTNYVVKAAIEHHDAWNVTSTIAGESGAYTTQPDFLATLVAVSTGDGVTGFTSTNTSYTVANTF